MLQLSNAYHDINLLELANFVIEDSNLYIVSSFGRFLKLDLNSGNILWSNNVHSTTTIPLINNNTVVLVSDGGFLSIYEKTSGKILFKKNLINFLKIKNVKTNNLKVNNIFLLSGKIYITSNEGYIFFVNSNNLQSIEYKKLSDTINSNIAISRKSISFFGNDDTIFKIQ